MQQPADREVAVALVVEGYVEVDSVRNGHIKRVTDL